METFLLVLRDGLAVGCIYALIALGYTMVYGIIKLINFAHGEFYMMGAYAGLFAIDKVGPIFGGGAWGTTGAFLTAMLAAGLGAGVIAVVTERFAYRPLRRASRISALLTALGVSLLLQNVALKAFSPDTRHFPSGISNRRYPRLDVAETLVRAGAVFDTDVCYLDENGNERLLTAAGAELNDAKLRLAEKHSPSGYYSYPAVTVTAKQIIIWTSVLVMTAGLQFLVRYTRMGKAMRAVSHDLDAAQLMGINTNAVISFTFFVGAFLAGAGGVLVGSYYNTIKPSMGVMYGLKAFVAAVLGGIGSINGAVLGGIVLGISERIVKLSPATAPYDHAFAFTVLVVILVFMPRGLLGRREGEKV